MSKPPPKGQWWKVFAAINILSITGADKAVLSCLVEHANAKTGRCFPAQSLVAVETGCDLRVVVRSVANLLKTIYVARSRRRQTSNMYEINFDALLEAFAEYKRRGAVFREDRTKTSDHLGKGHPTKTSDQEDKNVPSPPTKTSDKWEKGNGPILNVSSAEAAPPIGDAPPLSIEKVKNMGGYLTQFAKALKEDKISRAHYEAWLDWLTIYVMVAYEGMPSICELAKRLAGEIEYRIDEP
jgi:hypothetical protein